MFAPSTRAPFICARCLSEQTQRLPKHVRRQYSSQTSNPPHPPSSGAAKLTSRRLISLHGPEAPKFLQGLITNNVRPEGRQAGFYAAFLTAPGKVLYDVFVYPTLGSKWHKDVNGNEEPGYLVEVDAEVVDGLVKHMKKHKLRSKFKMRVLDEGEMGVWALWRGEERWTKHTQSHSIDADGRLGLVDCRAPSMGQRLLLPPSSGSGSGISGELELEEASLEAYTIRRYMKGVPEGQKEIHHDESLPMNCNMDIMGGIDFKKGCYLGQELTIRTHHTGVVRRRILPVALYEAGSAPPKRLEYEPELQIGKEEDGVDIRRDDKRKRATGKLIASVGNVGLGMCRLEQMSDLMVSGEGSSFSPEDTFTVQAMDGKELGVKAFVPDWLRSRIREPKIQRRVE